MAIQMNEFDPLEKPQSNVEWKVKFPMKIRKCTICTIVQFQMYNEMYNLTLPMQILKVHKIRICIVYELLYGQ